LSENFEEDVMSKREKSLSKSLRARGVRKKLAGQVARGTSGSGSPKVARRAMADLASVVTEIQDRLQHGPQKRSAAAKKAARTRKRKARGRSEAAKRGARTRARTT
jgi:type IV secretory pathway VirB6-like protein